jgi:hypothetical protein
MRCGTLKVNTVMEPGRDIFVVYSGYRGAKTTMESARTHSGELPGGNGYAKILGLHSAKDDGF